jgi:hypothetical protein
MLRRAGVLLAFVICAGCGGGRTFVSTGHGPALSADARIEVSSAPGGNRRVRIAVENLLPPGRLGEDLTSYSVWIVPPGGDPVPAGRLDYDAGSRRGRLTTITPYEDFRVLVSAEPPVPMGHPSGQVVIEEYVTS